MAGWTLRLLGTAQLHDGTDGVAAALRQPKRFALLAYLAAAGDGYAVHSRDTLQAMFWPDLSQPRARNALAQALHFLRRLLPHGALETHGRVAIGVARDALRCDAAELKRAAPARPRDVVELYGGELLAGLHVDGAPDFERWCDEERTRLAQLATAAAARLADEAAAAGDYGVAVAWARRSLDIRPYDEPAFRRLLALLDRTGDRAGAMALEAAFRARLEDEYGVKPSAETDALMRGIRLRHLGRPADAGAAPSSVAVLPFQDMSATASESWFADGLTEELIAMLAGVDGLHVVSRTSAFLYRNSTLPLRQIGRELGVETIVEGSIRRAGNRVRITAQLIDARTDAHLWAESYDRALTDVFDIQYDVAQRIAASLRSRFTPELQRGVTARAPTSLDAFHHYLRGRHLCQSGAREEWEKGIAAFHQALAVDPGYAAAYAGLADAYMQPALFSLRPPVSRREARQHARTAARRAIELAEHNAEAHSTLGMVQWYDWDWAASDASLRRAIALQPGYAEGHHRLGLCLTYRGRFDEADAELARAQELDPLSLTIFTSRGLHALRARRFDDAIILLRRALDIDPRSHAARHFLGEAHIYTGNYGRALDLWEHRSDIPKSDVDAVRAAFQARGVRGAREATYEMLTRTGGSLVIRATHRALLGDLDGAFQLLRQAVRERDPLLADSIRVHPGFDPFRADPRFEQILSEMNIPHAEVLRAPPAPMS